MKGRKGDTPRRAEGESHYQSDKGERKQGSTVVWRGSRLDHGDELRARGPVQQSSLAPGLLLALGQHPLSQ